MNHLKISLLLVLSSVLLSLSAHGQIRINKPEKVIERQAENRANRKIDQAVDKGFDKLEEGIGSIFKKKEKPAKEDKNSSENKTNEEENAGNGGGRVSGGNAGSGGQTAATKPEKASLKSYSKYDFIQGEKIVASEDFSQDAVGDFPAKWNTNGTAEVVTIEGIPGKWLMMENAQNISYIPDFVKDLPENFTLEFDLIYNNWEKKYAYHRRLYVTVHETEKSDARIQQQAAGRGATFQFEGGMGTGEVRLMQTKAGGGYTDLTGTKEMEGYINPENNGKVFHVSMWRQKSRLRIYVDEMKVFDLPRIFPEDIKLNSLRLHSEVSNEGEQVFVSNFRLAVGAPDTRSKLITEGKFVTTGITFGVNSAQIRPESYAVLKDIAATLTENPSVKVKIVGHTDSDGDDAANLELSKKRAESVKESLSQEFGIDKSRMETDGKGETAPAAPNTTPEGKANNRRVEFVKM
ncbi:OmpA family protein [Arundinibacter roseus]|uniref:OmpA family protein n=1 Tax=Arundinibacter roseus TaxID=2070510 RepID=A0A4R4JYE7_9BACT|nr:OmpA family protein [Arundinibacter roseus]TDB58669.1 OmpA family protein [Arundinibacter roseus]